MQLTTGLLALLVPWPKSLGMTVEGPLLSQPIITTYLFPSMNNITCDACLIIYIIPLHTLLF